MDGGKELARIPERDARGEGEHVDEQQQYGGRPTRRGESSYRERLGEEYRLETNSAARELPEHWAVDILAIFGFNARGRHMYAITHA